MLQRSTHTPDSTTADSWWCADCHQFAPVDPYTDLCGPCSEQQALVRLLDMVLETDQLAYDLQEKHWRAWRTVTDGDGTDTSDEAERIYHGEAEAALTTWLYARERQRYTVADLRPAGYAAGKAL